MSCGQLIAAGKGESVFFRSIATGRMSTFQSKVSIPWIHISMECLKSLNTHLSRRSQFHEHTFQWKTTIHEYTLKWKVTNPWICMSVEGNKSMTMHVSRRQQIHEYTFQEGHKSVITQKVQIELERLKKKKTWSLVSRDPWEVRKECEYDQNSLHKIFKELIKKKKEIINWYDNIVYTVLTIMYCLRNNLYFMISWNVIEICPLLLKALLIELKKQMPNNKVVMCWTTVLKISIWGNEIFKVYISI